MRTNLSRGHRILLVAAVATAGVLGAYSLLERSESALIAYLPSGNEVHLSREQLPSIEWEEFRQSPQPTGLKSFAKRALWQIRFRIWQFRGGKLNLPIPSPPRQVDLLGNVRVFPDSTEKNFLIAGELLSGSNTNSISFKFGGPRNATSQSDWVQANLDCIRTNGVVSGALQSTTLCAVIVDRKTVRILPAHYLDFAPQNATRK
jgi:hypothetical protein